MYWVVDTCLGICDRGVWGALWIEIALRMSVVQGWVERLVCAE